MLLAAALILHSVTVPGTQLDVKLESQVGRPYDSAAVERDVRLLWSLGRFDDVQVEAPEPDELVFHVRPKQRLVLRDVRLNPHSFGIEMKLPPETPLDPTVARQIARGVERELDARVDEKIVPRGDGKADLELKVHPEKRKKPELSDEIRYGTSKEMCKTLFLERRDSGPDFAARFTFDGGLSVERGREYTVGRIDFTGNHHYSDALVRRHFLLDEGARYDERLLRRSLARLNRSGMFDPIDTRQVLIQRDGAVANVTVRLTERKRGAWNIAGPWPLEGSVSAKLPKWATYAASLSLFGSSLKLLNLPHRFIPVFAIQRPFSPGLGWKSGFAIAPQLGLRGFAAGYAATQFQQRLLPIVQGERSAETPLMVTGDAEMSCVAKPRLRVLRTGATMALGFLGTLL